MKIRCLTENTLKISLTAYEITLLFGSYENIDYSNENNKKILGEILKKANIYTDSITDAKLYIEVMPDQLGGCSIYCTYLKEKMKKYRKISQSKKSFDAFCYIISNSDSLLKIIDNPNNTNCKIYKHKSNYILISTNIKDINRHTYLCELSDAFVTTNLASVAAICEHSKKIWQN